VAKIPVFYSPASILYICGALTYKL
jgi:hypothetical protein